MPPELDNMEPEMNTDMSPEMGAEPDVLGLHGEADHEGAMAKADLYKLANYSFKLFKKLQDDDQLEAWVQAKITKAADYIASVYHYLEYEMEFSEYGQKLDNSDVMNESQKAALKNKLMEAKAKIKELKKAQADKLSKKEKKVEEGQDALKKTGDSYKTAAGGTVTKTSTGVKHERDPNSYSDEDGDEKSGKGKKSHAKSMSAAEKKDRAPALKKSKTGTWGMENSEKFDNRKKDESIAEAKGKKPDFLDMDKDGDKKEPMKKAVADKKKGAVKEAAPSADLTKKEKSAVVKKAKAGGDIGKPGKSFDKVAKSAGGGEKGKKIAAAAMWKNIKETTAYIAEKEEVEKKAKKDYDGDGEVESGKDEHAGSVDKAIKASKAKETVKDSADMTRMREQMSRLNQNENIIVKESNEVDQLRALTKRLLG